MKAPLHIKSIKWNIFITFTIIIFTFLIVPLISVAFHSARFSGTLELDKEWEKLTDHVEKLNIRAHKNTQLYQNSFYYISQIDEISELLELRCQNSSLTSIYQNSSEVQQKAGNIYTQELNYTQEYLSFINRSRAFQKADKNLIMIRVFYLDGNILAGVINQSEDLSDYKGDKSWFQESITSDNVDDVLISPISIARQINQTNIRISKPLMYNNTVKGVMVVNYMVDSIICPIYNQPYSNDSINLLLDLNYENAEGEILDEIYIARSDIPGDLINETSAGNIEFKSYMFPEEISSNMTKITWKGKNYYYAYGKFSMQDRTWVTVTLEPQISFTEASAKLQSRLGWTFGALIISITGITVLFTYYAAKRLGKLKRDKLELISLLPICSNCKKIRDDLGYWNNVEEYLHEHTEMDFTHTLCPNCVKELYPDLDSESI